jgi:hypothetical protein
LTLSKSATQEREISLKPHKIDENLPNEEKKEKGPRLQEEETYALRGTVITSQRNFSTYFFSFTKLFFSSKAPKMPFSV